MGDLEENHPEAYLAAKHLIEHGVPIFVARRSPRFPLGGSSDLGYRLPNDWHLTEPDIVVLGDWREGDALGAVMGIRVDGIDIDPQKGGTELDPEIRPISYGRQKTPSGGTHDLIAPLGLASGKDIVPGVDYRAGSGIGGRGFLFLAPTLKPAKGPGGEPDLDNIQRYEWVETPDLAALLLEDDDSGVKLAEVIAANRRRTPDGGYSYDGPGYENLPDKHKEQADAHTESILFDWKVKLGEASGWSEGERDESGRGWESLARDAAWAVAMLAVCPWTALSETEAEGTYADLLPDAMAQNPSCKGKWRGDLLLEKAAMEPANQPPWWADVFFEQTEVLRRIRDAAWASIKRPEAMLAAVLGRVLAEVPVTTVLPSLVVGSRAGGSPASLNLGIAFVGKSGTGKSTTMRSSRSLLGLVGEDQKYIEKEIGSGEGIIDLFLCDEMMLDEDKGVMKPTGKRVLTDDPRVILYCDEVTQFAAVGAGRSGSTTATVLRKALTGERLGMSNSDAGKKSREVPEMGYRLISMVGVQPSQSDILLAEAGVGTPQRFLWCMCDDPEDSIPDPLGPDVLDYPESVDWTPPTQWPDVVWYPEHIKKEIIRAQYDEIQGRGSGGLDGHARLTRLKVAFALALLHGEEKIDDRWWHMSGILMAQGREVQKYCQSELAKEADTREIVRAVRQAKATVNATEKVEEDQISKAVEKVRDYISKNGEMTWDRARVPIRRYLKTIDKDDVIEALRETPGVTVEEYEAQGRTALKLSYKGDS